jgi:hypothetical protein
MQTNAISMTGCKRERLDQANTVLTFRAASLAPKAFMCNELQNETDHPAG